MMLGNGALIRGAARGLVGRPRGARERSMEQDDHEQADACGSRAPEIVMAGLHGLPKQILVL